MREGVRGGERARRGNESDGGESDREGERGQRERGEMDR